MDRRKWKKYIRKEHTPLYLAWIEGEDQGYRGKPYRNPYPKGKRHDEFKRGYLCADPMGAHHGRNV